MNSTIVKEILLENNQTLVISDLSRKIGEDAFVVKMEASIDIKINKGLFSDESISEFKYEDIKTTLGDHVVYKYIIERNFIVDKDKDEVFESLESTFMENLGQYVSKTAFPEKLVLKEYRDRIKQGKLASLKNLFRYLFVSIFVVSSALCLIPATNADIYTYIDSEGTVHFSNVPTSSDYKLYIRERPKKRLKQSFSTKKYDDIIKKAHQKYGVDFSLIKAVIKIESSFNPKAVSKKGAKGLMQIMPMNYKTLSIKDPFDPSDNIMGGALYLQRLLKRYKYKLPLVLAAYNAGPEAVDKYKQIPPYEETQNYVRRVMKTYSQYKKASKV